MHIHTAKRKHSVQQQDDQEDWKTLPMAKYYNYCKFPLSVLVQRGMVHPLVVRKRFFDIRAFVLIAAVKPLVAFFYKDRYVRGSTESFFCTGQIHIVQLCMCPQFFEAVTGCMAWWKEHDI